MQAGEIITRAGSSQMPKKQNTRIAAIGVDRGGTWTRVAALDSRLRPIRTARIRTAPLRSLPKKLLPLVSRWPGGTEAPLVIATRGAFSKPWKKPFLFKALSPKLNLIKVISDAEAAHFAAFRGKTGLLLIAGTGAVAFTGRPGAFKKTGGFNPASGDPGSGRWLGRQYLSIRGRLREAGQMGHGRSAAYAKRIISLALSGNERCAELAARAQGELAALLKEAAGKTAAPIKAALAGGLIANQYFRAGLLIKIKQALKGRKIVFVKTLLPAEQAAARLALQGRKPR